jgi:hypothetical protein
MKHTTPSFTKSIALFWVFTLLFQVCFPVLSFAITNGPSQPETQGFQPAGSSDMVDLFTGDFKYNIPLFDLEGYPVNLSYASNPGMEDEASWVGLGWTLSPGSVDRNMRGLPDDFHGDKVIRNLNIKDNTTIGLNSALRIKVVGKKIGKLDLNVGLFYNTKKGIGYEYGLSPTFSVSHIGKNKTKGLSGKLDLTYNSQSGVDVGYSIGLESVTNGITTKDGPKISGGINSREGMKSLNFSFGGNKPTDKISLHSLLDGGITFGTTTYTPAPDLTFKSRSLTLGIGVGGEVSPAFPHGNLSGFFTTQYLAEKELSQGAYGYLYSTTGAKEDEHNLLDYNKEDLNSPYSKSMIKLPLTYGTFDLFSANAQGLGAQFRALRGDIGISRDAARHSGSVGFNQSIDVGVGGAAHNGIERNVPWSQTESGEWKADNAFRDRASFTTLEDNSLYEPVAFKDAGEMMPQSNPDFQTEVGNFNPVYVEILSNFLKTKADPDLVAEKNRSPVGFVPSTMPNLIKKAKRERRNAVFSFLNGREASLFGLNKQIISYDENASICGTATTFSTRRTGREHHISEINITQPGGSRYVFGTPVYNTLQKEVTFSIEKNLGDITNEYSTTATYSDVENGDNNAAGADHYYEAKTLPPYATSFLINGLLSPDYVDLTGDGISDDDAGTAIKFNYTKTGTYKWRSPSNGIVNTGRYNPGNRADQALPSNKRDDKVSYVYGERELWYTHSIESKNYIARFYTIERNDGLGIKEEGDLDVNGTKLRQLERIEIYSRNELLNPNPTPIKTVHFEYTDKLGNNTLEYDLCPNAPNSTLNNSAKLTLHKVYFTYGKNKRGAKNIYKFDYFNGTNPTDFQYAMENMDRWGIYKEHIDGYPANTVFPFTYQPDPLHNLATEGDNNKFASVWNLNKITLPTGAEIKIDYESDTYAYVMNKRASQYIFVKGFSGKWDGEAENTLYFNDGVIQINYNYIHLNLPVAVNSVEEFKKLYLADMKGPIEEPEKLYFNCRVQLLPEDSRSYEYITGYAEIDTDAENAPAISLLDGGNVAVLKLKQVKGDRKTDLNPITKAALTTMRTELPDLAYGDDLPSIDLTDKKKAITILFPLLKSLGDLLDGFDLKRVKNSYARIVDTNNESWVRLSNPTYKKFGGGSRVKNVSISDQWASMATTGGHESAGYSTHYEYEIPLDETVENSPMISSGVAAYEPILGNEENLWRQPLTYKNKTTWLAPKTTMYQEAPVGEPLFPAPVIGYSQVKVTTKSDNITPNNPRTGTGHSVYQFYTAKDFPTKSDYTLLKAKKPKLSPILKFFKLYNKNELALSQGFVVEVNDMHGKPKSEVTYNESGTQVSATKYTYKQDAEGNLNNTVKMIKTNGDITDGTLGVDMDVWEDMSQENSETRGLGLAVGVDVGVPIPTLPHFFPLIQNDISRLRTSTTTKFIKRFGILDSIIKIQNGSSIYAKNLVFDAETGEPLLTETQSEYNGSPVFQFKYPAHWAYDGMGQTYKNQDAFFNNVAINSTTGKLSNVAVEDYLIPGDEVIIYKKPPFNKPVLRTYYISKTNGGTFLIDANGAIFNSPGGDYISLKVKRSARRNMATATIGAFESLVNPVPDGETRLIVGSETKVLQASASTFSDKWRIPYAKNRVTCTGEQGTQEELNAILCYMTLHDEWWYTPELPEVNLCLVTEPDLFLNGNCDKHFYALQPEPAYGYLNEYQLNIGECTITVTRPDGKKFNPKNLTCNNTTGCGSPQGLVDS